MAPNPTSTISEILAELKVLSAQMGFACEQIAEIKAAMTTFQDQCRHDMSGAYGRISELEKIASKNEGACEVRAGHEQAKPHKGLVWATVGLGIVSAVLILIEVGHHISTMAK